MEKKENIKDKLLEKINDWKNIIEAKEKIKNLENLCEVYGPFLEIGKFFKELEKFFKKIEEKNSQKETNILQEKRKRSNEKSSQSIQDSIDKSENEQELYENGDIYDSEESYYGSDREGLSEVESFKDGIFDELDIDYSYEIDQAYEIVLDKIKYPFKARLLKNIESLKNGQKVLVVGGYGIEKTNEYYVDVERNGIIVKVPLSSIEIIKANKITRMAIRAYEER